MSNEAKMQELLGYEKVTFKNLVLIRYWIDKHYALALKFVNKGDRSYWPTSAAYEAWRPKYSSIATTYNKELEAYTIRQAEYRKQPKSYWQEITDTTYKALKSAWDSFSSFFGINGISNNGVGFLPFLLPIVKWVGPIILAWIASTFFDKVKGSKDNTAELAASLATTNPEVALELSKIAADKEIQLKKDDDSNSITAQLGTALKWGVGIAVTAFAVKIVAPVFIKK